MKTTEVFTPVDAKVGLTTDGKILKFATLEDYEKAVDHEQEDIQTNMLAAIKSVKFKNYATLEQVNQPTTDKSKGQEMDDFLAQLLNVDGAVQIQDHIYKVDLAKEKVFVIKAEDRATHYQDLIHGNISNKAVSEYSTDDDVLYAVRDGINEKCGGNGTHTKVANPIGFNDNQEYEYYQFSIGNFKAGIYFSFRAIFELLPNPNMFGAPTSSVQFEKIITPHQLHLQFRPCNSSANHYYSTGTFPMPYNGTHSSKWVAASSSRNLNKISASMRGVLKRNGITYTTDLLTLYIN